MMPEEIIRRDVGGDGQVWHIEVDEATVTLTMPTREILLRWDAAETSRGVTFQRIPSGGRFAAFQMSRRRCYVFQIDGASFERLVELVERGWAVRGPEATRPIFWDAVVMLIIGFGTCAVTLALVATGHGPLGTDEPRVVTAICVLMGLCGILRGFSVFRRYARLKRATAPRRP